jgi:hypothetical protein
LLIWLSLATCRHHGRRLFEFQPQKTARSGGIKITVPLMEETAGIIAATAHGLKTYLVTPFGKPFTAAGFGNWFRRACVEAGRRNQDDAIVMTDTIEEFVRDFRCALSEIFLTGEYRYPYRLVEIPGDAFALWFPTKFPPPELVERAMHLWKQGSDKKLEIVVGEIHCEDAPPLSRTAWLFR